MSDHQHLLESLQSGKNSYALTQAGIALMLFPDAREKLEIAFAAVADREESSSFNYITYAFENDALLNLAISQARNAALRNCLKETFEVVSAYAKQTDQLPTLRRAPWYQFLRVVRNCLSHDFNIVFRKADRKHLPVTWKNLIIDESMEGKKIPMRGFLTRYKALQLVDEVMVYVGTEFF